MEVPPNIGGTTISSAGAHGPGAPTWLQRNDLHPISSEVVASIYPCLARVARLLPRVGVACAYSRLTSLSRRALRYGGARALSLSLSLVVRGRSGRALSRRPAPRATQQLLRPRRWITLWGTMATRSGNPHEGTAVTFALGPRSFDPGQFLRGSRAGGVQPGRAHELRCLLDPARA